MTISILGCIISIYLLYKLIKQNFISYKFMETLTFLLIVSSLFFDMGFYFRLNGLKLDYFKTLYILNLTFIIIFIVKTKRNYISKKMILVLLIFNTSILLSLIILYFNNFDILILSYRMGIENSALLGESALSILEISRDNYISFATLLLFEVFVLFNSKWINKQTVINLKKVFHIVFILIVIEFMITNIYGINVRIIYNYILGVRDSQVEDVIYRYGFKVSYGTFSEPSHISVMLIIYYNLYCFNKFSCKKDIVYYVISISVGLMSGSASSISVIIIFLLFKFISSIFIKINVKQIFKNQAILIFGTIALISIITFNDLLKDNLVIYLGRIWGFISNKGGISEVSRLNSIKFVLKSFIKSPFYGVGYGSTAATGLIPTILANFGIINFFFYIILIIFAIKINFRLKINIIKILMNATLWVFMGQFSFTYSPIMFVILLCILYDEKTIDNYKDQNYSGKSVNNSISKCITRVSTYTSIR